MPLSLRDDLNIDLFLFVFFAEELDLKTEDEEVDVGEEEKEDGGEDEELKGKCRNPSSISTSLSLLYSSSISM